MMFVIDKEYEMLVSTLSAEEYDSLKKSIKQNGLWVPIVINNDGIILDGHHRYKACQELGIKVRHTILNFSTKDEEVVFVGECNIQRRQLSSLQRIDIVRKLEPYYVRLARENSINNLKQNTDVQIFTPRGKTRDILGKKAQVSGYTYEKGIKILDTATPEEIAKINSGKKTISKVYHKIIEKEKKQKRIQDVQKLPVNLPDTIKLYNQEFQTLKITPNSVSLIFTDPPFHDQHLHLYDDLMREAYDVLCDGGSILCYVGQGNIGKVINIAEKYGLKFHWPLTILNSGPSASVFGKKILVSCKIMLWFVKGKYDGDPVRDCIQSEFEGTELHEWAKSTKESDYYIKHMTLPHEIVYDPFMGSGIFGVSAKKLKRQFIGCEVNKIHYDTAVRLISQDV